MCGVGPYAYAAAVLLPEGVLGVMTISTITQLDTLGFSSAHAAEHRYLTHRGQASLKHPGS